MSELGPITHGRPRECARYAHEHSACPVFTIKLGASVETHKGNHDQPALPPGGAQLLRPIPALNLSSWP
jgi:hypothetical protein